MARTRSIPPLWLSLALSAGTILLIFVLTGSGKTVAALAELRVTYIGLLLALAATAFLLEGARISTLVHAAGGNITLWQGCKLAALSVFGNMVTPFSTGGHVAMVYLLRQQQLASGRGTFVVLTRLLCTGMFILSGALVSLLLLRDLVSEEPVIRSVMLTTGVVFLGLSSLGVAALLNARVLATLGAWAAAALGRVGLLRARRRFQHRVNRNVLYARNCFRLLFGTQLSRLILALSYTGLLYAVQVTMLWAVLRALALPTTIVEGAALSALLFFLLSFLPTPGASGLGEAIFVVVYSAAVPTHLLGVAVLLWRLFYQYLPAAAGAIVAVRQSVALFAPGKLSVPNAVRVGTLTGSVSKLACQRQSLQASENDHPDVEGDTDYPEDQVKPVE